MPKVVAQQRHARPGLEPATLRSQVRRPTTKPPRHPSILSNHVATLASRYCIVLLLTVIQDWCKAIAVLLHYFFLAAFFLMLAEGVQMLLYIKFVFHARRKRETAALIFAAWCKWTSLLLHFSPWRVPERLFDNYNVVVHSSFWDLHLKGQRGGHNLSWGHGTITIYSHVEPPVT